MAFLKKPLKWTALGQEPSELKKSEGFKMDESPAPGHFDFMFRSTYEAIEELQQKAGEVKTVNNIQPDSNGNVLIPLPDVSKFYQKPTAGIPKTDLESSVQTALTKAESALQSVPLATAALDGLMAKSDKVSLDNVMSVFANLQKMKITNDDGSAVYTIGAALPTVKKGIFHATASTGTYAPPAPSVEGIIIAESASYWNFIGASDNGTWCVGTFQGSWKGWTTLATAKDVSNLSTRITALETSDTTHQADLAHVHWIGTATGTNTLTATYEAITALKNGLGVAFLNTTSSTLATTLNINGLGAIPILKANGNPVTNLKANGIYTLRYANGNFILQGEGGEYGTATASDVVVGKTIGTENGVVSGSFSNIKSIQRGSVITPTSNTVSITLPQSIDTAKSIIRIQFIVNRGYISSSAQYYFARASIVDANTIKISTSANLTAKMGRFEWEVIEFDNVKSLQKGSLTASTNGTEIPVSTSQINIAKSLLFYSYTYDTYTSSGDIQYSYLQGYIYSPNQINFLSNISEPKTVEWQLIEFN